MADEIPGDNRTDQMKHDAEALKIIELYAGLDADSAVINDKRRDLRTKADKIGYDSYDIQQAVHQLKKMSKGERSDHLKKVAHLTKVVEGRQAEFWPKDAERAEKKRSKAAEKATKAAAKAAEAKAKSIEAGDNNPRSKPKASSAKKPAKGNVVGMDGKPGTLTDTVAAGDALISKTAAELTADQEQREGAALLDTAGKPRSQSAIAAEIAAAAGTDKPIR